MYIVDNIMHLLSKDAVFIKIASMNTDFASNYHLQV